MYAYLFGRVLDYKYTEQNWTSYQMRLFADSLSLCLTRTITRWKEEIKQKPTMLSLPSGQIKNEEQLFNSKFYCSKISKER